MSSLFDLFISDNDTFQHLKTLAKQHKDTLPADHLVDEVSNSPPEETVLKLLPAQYQLITEPVDGLDLCLVQGGINCGKTW
jgi:hypothetical protein